MSETIHPAQELREAELELKIARQLSAGLAQARRPWQKLSLRRCATLSGIISLLTDADKKCRAAGTDPQAPLPAAIRNLETETRLRRRNLLLAYGIFTVVASIIGTIVCWRLFILPIGASPIITDPKAGGMVDMTISVSGSSPRGSLPPRTNLFVLVKPQGLDYWVQLLPDAIPPELNRTGWRAAKIGVGQLRDVGMHFRICAILTAQTLSPGWHAPDLPTGDSHCIDVIRK